MLHEEWGFKRTRKIGKEEERYKARREQQLLTPGKKRSRR